MRFKKKLTAQEIIEPGVVIEKASSTPEVVEIGYSNPTNHVLHLITNKSMTSRDIQITLKKESRAHFKVNEKNYLKMVWYREIQKLNPILIQLLKKVFQRLKMFKLIQ